MPRHAFDTLDTILGEVTDLRRAASLIEWDEQVYMPPGGAAAHGQMTGTIRKIAHQRFTSDEVGALLAELTPELDGHDGDTDRYRLIATTAREFEKARRVPADFVAEEARALSAAHQAWVEARSRSDLSRFQSHRETIVALKRQYVAFHPKADHPYDVLLDDFEPGMRTADVHTLLAVLRPRQVELVRALGDRSQVDDAFLRVPYDEAAMCAFGTDVITAIGFDFTRGRQDRSVHPFASGIGPDDVRITTRYVQGQPLSIFFGTVHETGHALYEQGISHAYTRGLLGDAASLGVHESQSRLWENLVGRSLPFWEYFFPALQRRFPAQLRDVTLEQSYRGINKVRPSLIRVESDETTYNLHVMLRVELEIALLEGSLAVADLPEAWRARMSEYLGLEPTDDATGVLQDIHWSGGLFGYFATYTLGNVISVQLWETFGRVHPTRDDDIRRGDFSALLAWLREGVHRHGRKYEPQELVERVTGSRIDPEPYLRYLEQKYRPIYGI